MTEASTSMFTLLTLLGTIFSIVLFLSPYKTIKQIRAANDTTGITFAPFLMITVNCILVTLYGFVIRSGTMIGVNAIGIFAGAYYLSQYYKYTRDKGTKQTIQVALFGVFVCFIMIFYYIFRIAGENARFHLGLMTNAVGIAMFASPLSSLSVVLQKRNAASIALPLSASSLCCSLCWFLFGYLLWDFFIMIPNIIGMSLSSFQLYLIWKFGQRTEIKGDFV